MSDRIDILLGACSRRTIIIFLWACLFPLSFSRARSDPAYVVDFYFPSANNIPLFLQTSIAWNIHGRRSPPSYLTTVGFRLRSCLSMANFFVKLILHEKRGEGTRARAGATLSGKNYPLFPRQILHEIFIMVRIDAIDFGQLFGRNRVPSLFPSPFALRFRCELPFRRLIRTSGFRDEKRGEGDAPRIIGVHPFSHPESDVAKSTY